MEYKRFGNEIVARFDPQDEIIDCVLKIAKAEDIKLASVRAIGATDDFTVGVFNMEKKAYDEFTFTGNHEITNLAGTLSTMNGEYYQHLHITCAGPGAAIVGGHLLKAVISLTCEVVITVIDGKVDRKRNEAIGINGFCFD